MQVKSYGYKVFETEIGWLGIVFGQDGIVRIRLPEHSRQATQTSLLAGIDAVDTRPDENARLSVKKIIAHLQGDLQDFSDIVLDYSQCPPFHARVYQALRTVPAGELTCYQDLAKLAGSPRASRAVGQAMAKNPFALIVPCHRVIAADGKLGGFSSYGGTSVKVKLLSLEGRGPNKKEKLEVHA